MKENISAVAKRWGNAVHGFPVATLTVNRNRLKRPAREKLGIVSKHVAGTPAQYLEFAKKADAKKQAKRRQAFLEENRDLKGETLHTLWLQEQNRP